MKTLKAICTVAVLVLALSVPVYAGDMLTPGFIPPPPPPPPELNVTVPTATFSSPSEMSSPIDMTPSFGDILWVLASIF